MKNNYMSFIIPCFNAENTIQIDSHNYRLNDINFSHDGQYLATCSIDKTLKIYMVFNF